MRGIMVSLMSIHHLILKNFQHSLHIAYLQNLIFSLKRKFFSIPVVILGNIGIDLVPTASLNYDLSDKATSYVTPPRIFDRNVLYRPFFTNVRKDVLHDLVYLCPKFFLTVLAKNHPIYQPFLTIGNFLNAEVDRSALGIEKTTESTLDFVSFARHFSNFGDKRKTVILVLYAQALRLTDDLTFCEECPAANSSFLLHYRP